MEWIYREHKARVIYSLTTDRLLIRMFVVRLFPGLIKHSSAPMPEVCSGSLSP